MLRSAVIVLILLVLLPVSSVAQTPGRAAASLAAHTPISTSVRVQALSKMQLDRLAARSRSQQRPPQSERRRSTGRIVLGAAVGATAGFFAGGYLGAAIDGDCGGCDDPGFKGFLIGFPVGGVVGGVLGGLYLFR